MVHAIIVMQMRRAERRKKVVGKCEKRKMDTHQIDAVVILNDIVNITLNDL